METYDISAWKKAQEKKAKDRERRRFKILNEAREKLHEYFTSGMEIKHVYITGSILQPDNFNKYSDIDVAVEGLPETRYFKTKAELETLLTITVDLIELEHCTFRDLITENGLKIL